MADTEALRFCWLDVSFVGSSSLAGVRLTDQICKNAALPEKGNRLVRCSETKGFAIRVTSKGARSFVFGYYNARCIERRLTIGPYPAWSVVAARKRAEELRRLVDQGQDPLEEKRALRAAETLSGLWDWYSETALAKLAPSSQADSRSVWRRIILPILGPRARLEALQRRDVQAMLDKATDKFGPVIANRAHSYLRRALNLAVAEGWLERNVATMAIARNVEHPRERYLSPEELGRLLAVLESARTVQSRCLRFIALTGCRKSEAMFALWEEIDLARGIWTKAPQNTKARRKHVVPLSTVALNVLEEARLVEEGSRWVFPSEQPALPITELKFAWRRACREAGLAAIRIHDLRHTFASLVASRGGSLEIAGALLGHSQAQTTLRYAHLFEGTLREAAEGVASEVCARRDETASLSHSPRYTSDSAKMTVHFGNIPI